MNAEKWRLVNVILLGLGFMLVFTAFQTTSMISKFVTSSLKMETKNSTAFDEIYTDQINDDEFMSEYTSEKNASIVQDFKYNNPNTTLTNDQIVDEQIKDDIVGTLYGDGYISLSLVYAVFSLANFLSPAVVKVFGHKATMFVSGLTYLMYICMFLTPTPIFMYVSSVILGFGAAFIWTAQGEFLHLQSASESLMARNTGIFWCMFQSSLLVGNIYVSIKWQGASYVSSDMRTSLFSIFAVLAAVGCSVFLLLRGACCRPEPVIEEQSSDENTNDRENDQALLSKGEESGEEPELSTGKIVITSIINAFKLLVTRDMILIASLFLYSGFALSFFSGVYTTAVGNSKNLKDSAATVGLVGMSIGIGEVLGGGLFVFGAKLMDKVKRPQLLIGCILLHFVAFGLVLANIPLDANIESTDAQPAFFEATNKTLVLLTAFLLGFGDAGVNNVIYTSISTIWHADSAPAFALMKCIQSAACAISFAIASKINLMYNVIILVVFAVMTIVSYISLHRVVQSRQLEESSQSKK